jgi:hypothetical protein
MPKYHVITQGEGSFTPMRYDNFALLNATVEPAVPWVLVPLCRDVSAALQPARALRERFVEQIQSMGLESVLRNRLLAPEVSRSATDSEIAYLSMLQCPFQFFRGERSLRFSIMPTRYRWTGDPQAWPAVLRQRLDLENSCANRMRDYLREHGVPNASNDQARAAARHYGVPSSFVDFTFNPDVAAFFAHPAWSDSERARGPDVATLYALGLSDLQQLFGMAAWGLPPEGGRDIRFINVANVWRIPYKSFDPESGTIENATLTVHVPPQLQNRGVCVRTRSVPQIKRIVAQEGIFLDFDLDSPEDAWSQEFLWTVLDFAANKWCFLRGDFAYENESANITAAKLFPPDNPGLTELLRGFERAP